MSLRTRLLAGMFFLVSLALVVAAAAIYEEQRSFLLNHLDQRVIAAATPISYQLGVDARTLKRPAGKSSADHDEVLGGPRSLGRGLTGFLPSGTYGALVDPEGHILRGPVTVRNGETRPSPPAFSSTFPVSHLGPNPTLFTVNSRRGSGLRYRVAVLPLDSGAGSVIVAIPLTDVDQTLDQLLVVEGLVVGILLLTLTGIGWIVIRIGLRPLEQMERVAREISEGDLSRRVTPATPRTEIGRLGLTLNKMLSRIEEAFADRARSEERRKRFLSDASHELRTPLASLRGYAELFRMGPAQDPVALKRAMARIESEAARMGALVDNLLLLARLDEVPEAQHVPVNLNELAVHAVADARATAPEREIVLDDDEQLTTIGHPDGLRQVLANLMSNALTHTPEGTPVAVSLRRADNRAILEVRDHGPGLPADADDRVFDRFWRNDEGRSRGRGGAGLGLAIVREIVQAHHGTVAAANAADGGAVITVRLPLAPLSVRPTDGDHTPVAALGTGVGG
jgi:two-component system OmpR family sensor kinase